jgi:hypothetical protein
VEVIRLPSLLQNDTAQEFMGNVDTAAVYHNASTRFTMEDNLVLAVNLPSVQTSCIKEAQLVYNTWLPINGIFMERDRLGRLHCSVFSNQFKKYLLNKKTLKFQE